MFQISMTLNHINIDDSMVSTTDYTTIEPILKITVFFKHSLANAKIWFSLIVHFSNKIQITIS